MKLPRIISAPIQFDSFGISDRGMQRPTNQDHLLIADLHKLMKVQQTNIEMPESDIRGEAMGKLLFVADGVGGNLAGEVASRVAILEVNRFLLNSMHWLLQSDTARIEDFVNDLKRAVNFSHANVLAEGNSIQNRHGMGTTLTMAYIVWPSLYVVHVGDSRCYVLHDNLLEQVTKDQTYAQELVDRGMLESGQYNTSHFSRVLWSSIGAPEDPTVTVYRRELDYGDTVMVCSDGVNRHWSNDELKTTLVNCPTAEEACQRIIDTANQRGGKDNITVAIARCLRSAD